MVYTLFVFLLGFFTPEIYRFGKNTMKKALGEKDQSKKKMLLD